MIRYREILRRNNKGFSEQNIARDCSVSRNPTRRVIDIVDEIQVSGLSNLFDR